jgi:hypothetical protein
MVKYDTIFNSMINNSNLKPIAQSQSLMNNDINWNFTHELYMLPKLFWDAIIIIWDAIIEFGILLIITAV